MALLDSFPTVEEIAWEYKYDGVQEPRSALVILPEEYEEIYGPQFSYELKLIIYYDHQRTVAEPITYDVSDYHFSATLGLGVHKQIGLAVVFHRDPRKNYILSLLLFEKYAQGVLSQMQSFREAMDALAVKDEQLEPNLLAHCTVGTPRLEHTRALVITHMHIAPL